jgi:hypothetical protein
MSTKAFSKRKSCACDATFIIWTKKWFASSLIIIGQAGDGDNTTCGSGSDGPDPCYFFLGSFLIMVDNQGGASAVPGIEAMAICTKHKPYLAEVNMNNLTFVY